MTNHPFDLRGVDTGKIGNNKNVNYTLKDYQKDQDVSRAGALELLGLKSLEGLNPIAPTLKKPETIREKIRSFLKKGPSGTETEIVGGKVVGKDRPDNIITRPLAGLLDFTTFGLLDTDQRGNLFGGTHSFSGYGGGQELDYKLPKVIREQLAKKDKAKEDKGSTDPIGDIKAIYKEQMEYEKAMDPFKRKGRALDSAMEFANLQAQMPFYMRQLKDLTTFKQQQLLDSELVKQSMPDAREARKLSSASRFAGELGAVGDAYAKAVTGAQAGIRQPTATFSV
mgnify:CR=1 FL=1|tara:strand:- start:11 stop:856 length:846 start_codon:yes stop_codon:yes gene_type:complete